MAQDRGRRLYRLQPGRRLCEALARPGKSRLHPLYRLSQRDFAGRSALPAGSQFRTGESRRRQRKARPSPARRLRRRLSASVSALRDWLTGHVESDAAAADTIADFFAAIEHDLNADPAHDGHAVGPAREAEKPVRCGVCSRGRRRRRPRSTPGWKSSRRRRGGAETAADLAPRLAELAERVSALEQTPAPPPLMPGFAPVSKSAEVNLDDLAAELALLSPEKASLVLIKAAQTRPQRFG